MAVVMEGLQYQGYKGVSVNVLTYENGRIAIQLLTEQAGWVEPLAMATVNFPEFPCPPDEVWVKSWSENEGMESWLIDQGIILAARDHTGYSGHVQAFRHKLTPAFQRLMFASCDA